MNKRVPTHIKLQGAVNARHLGGYEGDLGTTREDACIRMDAPTRLSENDIKSLMRRGVTTVIDLRGKEELITEINPFEKSGKVDFYHIPLLDSELPPHMIEGAKLEDLYYHMINDCQDTIAEVMKTIIDSEGTVIFHCTAGKDRTGVIAALLLSISGIPEDTIVKEYSYTEILLAEWRDIIISEAKKNGADFDEDMLEAKPEFIRIALDQMSDKFHDPVGYAKAIGLNDGDIKELRRKMLKSPSLSNGRI